MKYTEKDLENLSGKPVYIKSLDDKHVWKSGWAIVDVLKETSNIFASNGKQTILLSTFLGKWFEAYDEEPLNVNEKDRYKRELMDAVIDYNRTADNSYLSKAKDLINKLEQM